MFLYNHLQQKQHETLGLKMENVHIYMYQTHLPTHTFVQGHDNNIYICTYQTNHTFISPSSLEPNVADTSCEHIYIP